MSNYFLFSSYHNTKIQLSDKNISTHTRSIFLFYEVNQKFKRFFCYFSLYRAIQKGNQASGQNRARIGAYCVVQTLYHVNRGFARLGAHLYAHDFAPLLGFLSVWRDMEKNNKTFFLL